MSQEFANKVFIVTGATSGIGKATALMAVERGAKVALVARRQKELIALSSSLNADSVEPISADLTKDSDRTHVIAQTIKRPGEDRD